MKIFAIRDESDKTKKALAYLFCYEKENRFYIELPDDADFWETPMILSSVLKKGEHTVNAYWSKVWVRQRIIPPDRQNIGQILRDAGLKEYDEYRLLIANKGRCSQDSCYLTPVDESDLPPSFVKRQAYKVEDAVPLPENRLMVLFRDGTIKLCRMADIAAAVPGTERVLRDEKLFAGVGVQTGGYGISWGDELSVPDKILYDNGTPLPLRAEDLNAFVRYGTVNTAEAADMLDCSRQYIDRLTQEGKLHPIKKEQKSTLYLKRELNERKWR